MAQTEVLKPTAASGNPVPAPKAPNYDHLPDLGADDSMDDGEQHQPTFEQLHATLMARGYLRSALNVTGMRAESVAVLADALHAMISQREEDIEVRTALTAKNRTLTASLERTKRFLDDASELAADAERKAEAAKARLVHVSAQLESEQNAHKATKDALARMRRDVQVIKASALQYKGANDRSVARVRARIGEVTSSAIRSAVPDFQIVASAFDDLPTSSTSRAGTAGVYAQQVQELEQKRTSLVEYNQALKRLATDAINAARRADQELLDMVQSEQEDANKRSAAKSAKSRLDAVGTRSASSSSLSGSRVSSRKISQSDTWLEGHRPLFQRDLFPAADTLRSTPSGVLVSASSSKLAHPALRALEHTSTAISSHVQTLLDLRTERNAHEATTQQRFVAELKEQVWSAKVEHEIHEDLQNDARLSLNKVSGPGHLGSLSSAAIAASSGASLRRSEASHMNSKKRPLSNATNSAREALGPAADASKTQKRTRSSTSSLRARS